MTGIEDVTSCVDAYVTYVGENIHVRTHRNRAGQALLPPRPLAPFQLIAAAAKGGGKGGRGNPKATPTPKAKAKAKAKATPKAHAATAQPTPAATPKAPPVAPPPAPLPPQQLNIAVYAGGPKPKPQPKPKGTPKGTPKGGAPPKGGGGKAVPKNAKAKHVPKYNQGNPFTEADGTPKVCYRFRDNGTCDRGQNCAFLHAG